MNRLFDSFWRVNLSPWAPLERGVAEAFTPRVNVSETDKEIKVSAELPGLDENDIDVSLTRDALTIKGEKKEEKEEKEPATAAWNVHMVRSPDPFRFLLM